MSEKLHVLVVGVIINDQPLGWVFDGGDGGTAISISDSVEWGGYTLAELQEIMKRHNEQRVTS